MNRVFTGSLGVISTLLFTGIFTVGCEIRVIHPDGETPAGESQDRRAAHGSAKAPEDQALKYRDKLPKTVGLLVQAEDAIAQNQPESGADLVNQARDALKTEGTGHDDEQARKTVTGALDMLAFTAAYQAGKPFEALAIYHDGTRSLFGYDTGFEYRCQGAAHDACSKAYAAIRNDFKGIFVYGKNQIDVRYDIDRQVSSEGMDLAIVPISAGGEQKAEGKYVVYADPQAITKDRAGVMHLSWMGQPGSYSSEECQKVGTVRVENPNESGPDPTTSFDLQRCGDVQKALTPAAVKLSIDAADAPLVDRRKKGELIAVLLDRKNLKHAGASWDLGAGRAFWVGHDQTYQRR